MTPKRFEKCLSTIRWTPDTLASALGCYISIVHAWLDGLEEVPPKAAAWIETLAIMHTAAEELKPVSLKGKRARMQ
ncbi:MAG: hypothetical protein BGN87_18560 [Rhizobiales bacterium 65-79]|nr:hypothetical protein [Hyphomicrobiales bacterium]OJU03621.1 MAG: hypothetical protein BGN87_18560 [Rhizobiales bacterium 65-79]